MADVITTQIVRHPLHPLSAAEITEAVDVILRETGLSKSTTRFVSVSLKEPPK